MSSAQIWKNAPSAICHPRTISPHNSTHNPDQQEYKNLSEKQNHPVTNSKTPSRTELHHTGNVANRNTPDNSGDGFRNTAHQGYNRQANIPIIRQLDDVTTETFNSNTSTTLNSTTNAARFAELDASIKANQAEIKQMNHRFETLDNRMIETMSSCHENSKQLVTMHGQINNLQRTIQTIADQMSSLTAHIKNISTHEQSPQSPLKNKNRPSEAEELCTEPTTQAMNIATHLPKNPTLMPDDNDALLNPPLNIADQAEVQYNEPHFSGTAMEE
jgi:prefoldin subunit 5